jgi:lipopolysaccharide/colanic/teichoic acid biosynthesis glycosyltransferase
MVLASIDRARIPRSFATAAAVETASGSGTPDRPYFRFRHILEVMVSAAALLALSPAIAGIALAVLIDLGRPVLFRQLRPGRHMRVFTLYKFRTMGPAYGPGGALLEDLDRTSPLGRLLRRSRLDEIPQLFNVLRGDMSLIGPRPLLPRDLPDDMAYRAAIRPGITGWAQVNGGHRLTIVEKTALDRWYIRHAGPWLDARIAALTLWVMLIGERVDRGAIERAWRRRDA